MSEGNISNMALYDEPVDLDLTAEQEPQGFAKIPDATYLMELSLGKNGVNVKKSQAGRIYVEAHVRGRIIAPGTQYDGLHASGFVTNIPFKDKASGNDSKVSVLQQLLKLTGWSGSISTQGELAQAVEQTLSASPQVHARTRWEASAKVNGKWERVSGMRKFPQNADGSYSPFADIGGEEVEARENIVGFYAGNGATA